MATIQLLITDRSNREALARLLADRHDILVDEAVQQADAYLVDDRSFPRYREDLARLKREADPIFCPVVLVRRESTGITIEVPDPDEIDPPLLVDEILTAPVGQEALMRSLVNLLARRQQTRELVAQNERLDEFASKLTHELRNPLNTLQGYLSMAREEPAPEHFERAQQSVDRIDRMIDDILLLARQGETELAPEPLSLAEAARTAWESVRTPEATLRVETDLWLEADRDRLYQLLENLFRNAVEHGGDDVTVTVDDREGGFAVADDGSGIPAAERRNVFEEGYTTEEGGTGLGLAIISEIADAHGWTVAVDEGSDGGARFDVTGVVRSRPDDGAFW